MKMIKLFMAFILIAGLAANPGLEAVHIGQMDAFQLLSDGHLEHSSHLNAVGNSGLATGDSHLQDNGSSPCDEPCDHYDHCAQCLAALIVETDTGKPSITKSQYPPVIPGSITAVSRIPFRPPIYTSNLI